MRVTSERAGMNDCWFEVFGHLFDQFLNASALLNAKLIYVLFEELPNLVVFDINLEIYPKRRLFSAIDPVCASII